jgi:glycosyltransferase involved in cell wall biosynthesis
MMRSLAFLVPGRLDTRTGGYEYDRQIIDGLRRRGWEVVVRTLDGSFPHPTAAALAHARDVLAALPRHHLVLIDGLALGAMPGLAAEAAPRLSLMALVHHPLAGETGLDAPTAARLKESERRALQCVRRIVVTSATTAAGLADYGVTSDRVVVVEPGTARSALSGGSGNGPTHFLCVASLSPRKGHEVLFRALARLRHRAWRLTCVGDPAREPAHVARLQTILREESLTDRVQLAGEADAAAIATHYDRADVFVLPTLYEGYGMVVAEALAHGLPVLSTPTGAIAELVRPGAGRLIDAGDIDGWTAALTEALEPAARDRWAEAARLVRDRLPTWEQSLDRMVAALATVGVEATAGGAASR